MSGEIKVIVRRILAVLKMPRRIPAFIVKECFAKPYTKILYLPRRHEDTKKHKEFFVKLCVFVSLWQRF